MSARSELLSGLAILVVTLISYFEIQRIEGDALSVGIQPATFPEGICILLGATTLFMVCNAARKMSCDDLRLTGNDDLRLFLIWVLPMALIAFAYIALIDLIQYLVPTALALSVTLAIFGNRGLKWSVTIPAVASVIYYAVFFGLFRLDEPRGRLVEYDNFYIFGTIRNFLGI
jgi:hypothetical protein